jgi:hypothetical protein
MRDLSSALTVPKNFSGTDVRTYDNIAEGVVTRSVDLTPQHLNYTGSASPAFSNVSFNYAEPTISSCFVASAAPAATAGFLGLTDSRVFQPTQKELESATRVSTITDKPRRGRKRSKITGNE